jgi:hypothetical protein
MDDPGEPLEGVEVRAGGGPASITDASGVARLELQGHEGTTYDLGVVCPQGFALQGRPIKVALRRANRMPEFSVACRRLERNIVVAVRTTKARDIPILYLGSQVGKTDETGYALVSFEPRVGETLTLTLDTSAPQHRFLRPQNPELSLSVPDTEETFAVGQEFTEERPKVKHFAPAKPHLPIRLDSPGAPRAD